MFELLLPQPSETLLQAVVEDMQDTLTDHVYFWDTEGREKPWPIGVVENIWFNKKTAQIGKQEYQHLFDDDIHVCGMLFAPDPRSKISCLPPHTDAGRMFGINYILDQGGHNVYTSTYAETVPSEVAHGDFFRNPDDFQLENSLILDLHKWYGLNGLQYHSVENITRNRILLTITLDNMCYDRFLKKYKHLIN